jgi:hypothetical protein
MNNQEKEIRNIEKGDAWNDTDEIVELSVKKPLDKVIPIRLPADVWEKLRHEAKDRGIGPTTLARMWIIERLKGQSPPYQEIHDLLTLLKQNSALNEALVSEKKTSYEKK